MKTPESVTKEFKAIVQQEKKMKGFSGNDVIKKENYYFERDVLNKLLVQFLRNDFTTLNKEKFLKLCDMCSTYRPVAPFSFLVSISMRKKEQKSLVKA